MSQSGVDTNPYRCVGTAIGGLAPPDDRECGHMVAVTSTVVIHTPLTPSQDAQTSTNLGRRDSILNGPSLVGAPDTVRTKQAQRVECFGPDLQRAAEKKLKLLNAASEPNSLRGPPGNRLEKLVGNRSGQHSIRVDDQYRICFVWTDNGRDDVEITDYH